MSDARFSDGAEAPLRLRAETPEDLAVISALVQDAVASVSEIAWTRRRRRFALLLNRFRWEDAGAASRQGRPFERVQAVLDIDGALRVRSSGLDPAERDTIVSILALAFEPDGAGGGRLRLTLAGDGEISVEVECLDVQLTDVSRPYVAPSGRRPGHPD